MFFTPLGSRTFCWLPSLVDTTVKPREVVDTKKLGGIKEVMCLSHLWSHMRLSIRTGSDWLMLLVSSQPRLVSVYWQML